MSAPAPVLTPEQRQLEERIRQALEGLQHSHVNITQTTRGPTFEVKIRDIDPYKAADVALELYEKMKKALHMDEEK